MRTVLSRMIFVFVLLSNPNVAFADDPVQPSARMRWNGDRLEYLVTNPRTYDITCTVRMTLTNLVSDRPLPVTRTIPPGREVLMATLRRVDPARKTHVSSDLPWIPGRMEAHHDASHVYRLPAVKGTRLYVVQGFHGKFSHRGYEEYAVDFDMAIGTAVLAARDGVVVGIQDGYTVGAPNPALKNKANYILILHSDGTFGEYYHFKNGGILVKLGQKVVAGERIGLSGNTGYTSRPHLHFIVFRAQSGLQRESFPVRFRVDNGQIVEPQEGKTYTAP